MEPHFTSHQKYRQQYLKWILGHQLWNGEINLLLDLIIPYSQVMEVKTLKANLKLL